MPPHRIKVCTIVGARPQFIKAAAVSRAMEARNRTSGGRVHVVDFLVHTGQHYDDTLSGVFFRDLALPEPRGHLGVGSGPHGRQTAQMLSGVEEVLMREKPDWVLVHGDTNSTLAGALAAVKLHIPVAHVEAGLRSFNRRMPEEHNRVVTDHLSTLLLCPTEIAIQNLQREGIGEAPLSRIRDRTSGPVAVRVGDVMFDSILHYVRLAESRSEVMSRLRLEPGGYALATIHRAENTDTPEHLMGIFRALERLAEGGVPVVLPLHPRTRAALSAVSSSVVAADPSLKILDPAPYLDMLLLEKNARVILTDSGGVQKEAYWMQVPCVTLREETEWMETVESGWNVLAGADEDRIVRAARSAVPGHAAGDYYGDGHAADKIVEILASF